MVELKQVSAGYPDKPILSDITLSFPPGQVLALVGPNGCGKSTLLKTACGLLPPQGGEIFLDGRSLTAWSRKEVAQRISYLSQERTTPEITAQRMVLHGRFPHLSYPRRYRNADHEIVADSLRRADALALSHRFMPQLSGGQRQRVYLAMSLAQQGDTLLLDEPTTYLDISHQLRVLRLARSLAEEGKAVVLILHDLPLALAWADQIAVLDGGRLLALGGPDEIFSSKILERVFSIRLERVRLGDRWQYFCLPIELM